MSRGRDDLDENRWSLEEAGVLDKLAVLRAAADESARYVRGRYFTFLLFAAYVAIVVFSTNDEQLLKETGARLPLLNVELPLVGFYVVIPWLVLIFHAHLLSQFYLLSRKLFDLDRALESLPTEPARVQRGLIFPLIFSHGIIGTQHPRLIRWVFGAAVVVTILAAPVALLLAIQWRFLPYHGEWITINHQLVLTLDLLLLWLFWPRLFSQSGRWRDWWSESRPGWRRWVSTISGFLVSATLIFGAWTLLVPHVGGIEAWLAEKWLTKGKQKGLAGSRPGLPWIHRNLELRERTLMRREPPVALLSAVRGKGAEAEAEVWLKDGEALNLRGRDLRYADFSQSRLWDADLRGAQLQGAAFRWAQLQGAVLLSAQLQSADLRSAQLQGAELLSAQLQGAELQLAQLQGADLRSAQLQGAVLRWTELQGAYLEKAQLQGADLLSAQLQGADLEKAQLQGANLQGAQLQGAYLWGARLQGAELQLAQLQGANLQGAQLQGAELQWAQLRGADLRLAVVYGTWFQDAELSLADLRDLRSWPVGWEEPPESWSPSSEPEWEPFSRIEVLGTRLEREGEHWSQPGRERVEKAIDGFWSIAFDLSLDNQFLKPTTISPLQGFEVMHDWQGPLATWPAPPDVAGFEPAHVGYRAGLACNDRHIAQGLWRQAIGDDLGDPVWTLEGDPVLEQALRAKAASGECPALAEVLKQN
ncbi:MAG: pentapeptide repeat-containing protein [Candidatus Thiosymbion ectosymbiont of Robbea hypermnestra]|nr:pentapeptide repeat-containing protein [Candidatus Thiosymbion ectosymbiont of Robbea hypermnestra]